MSPRIRILGVCLAVGLLVPWVHPAWAQGPGGRGQQEPPAPPPINRSDDPLLRTFTWRSIGPASMAGRIDAIEGVDSNPSTFYVAFATGGLWKTENNGTTFTPLFDTYPIVSIGAIAISQSNPNIVWVGTGEANNRQSSSFGAGIYKSTDGGKTFASMGLAETQTIARIVIHPRDPNIVYVAALGHLFGSNPERGLYKTTDGGKTWTAIKQIDADTGFTDLVMDPSNPNVLLAASYQRRRTPFGFNGGGPGSALWKTTDGGKTWQKLEGNGLPTVAPLGRIGLAYARSNPRIVYAQIEVGASAGTGGGVTADGKPLPPGGRGFGAGGFGQQQQQEEAPPDAGKSGVWRSDDGGRTWKVMSNNNNRPMYYSLIRVDPKNPDIVYTGGAPFHKSIDGGKTFKVVDGIAHSDHHALWIDPTNPRHLILGNDGGIDVTYDEAATWEFVNTLAVGQFYAIGADMQKPYFICGGLQDNGSWCGPSAVRSNEGITNADWFRVGGGDGFYAQIDPTDPFTVYSESQDGNMGRLDLRTGERTNIKPRAAPPPRRPRAQQTAEERAQAEQQQAMQQIASRFGFGGSNEPNVVPEPPAGTIYRFYWNTPLLISPHNPRKLIVGGNRVFISLDRGDTWTASEDLTRNVDRFKLPIMGVDGMAPMASKFDGYATNSVIVTLAESPLLPGVIWAGTDDGNLQVSRDNGATWKNVVKNVAGVPDGTFVSRVEPSHYDPGTCYATFDGHRTDDHKPYLFVTRDFGESWQALNANLPEGHLNVIREDPKNRNILYLGSEYAFYVSLDGGKAWARFMTGMPTVPIDDILVHPRDNDLIAGTHGRSIWIIDDLTPLQALDDKVRAEDVQLFQPRPATQWYTDPYLGRSNGGAKNFVGQNPEAGTAISYYLKAAASGDVKITISDITGKVVRNLDGAKDAGLNRVQWDLRENPPQRPANMPQNVPNQFRRFARQGPPVEPGTYLVKLSVDGKEYTTTVVVEADEALR
jgi:photosystem II stability/assembly factor-like uncharacterized protein